MPECNKAVPETVLRNVVSVTFADVETVDNAADQAERFRTLARQQLPRLYSIARRLVGVDAEDAVPDCLLKARFRDSTSCMRLLRDRRG